MAWLDDHPPARSQFRDPRREPEQGVIVVHTAENVMDTVGPDTGAENVANFIRTRDTPGSYHDLVDRDSVVNLVRDECEAFHDATGSNPWSWGLSFACSYLDWVKMDDDARDAFIESGARRARDYAVRLKARRGIEIPARLITRAQSEQGARGFISHAKRDPDRRKDPGNAAGQFPWAQFLARYDALVPWGSTPPEPTPEDDDMPKPMLCRLGTKDSAVLYISSAKVVHHVPTPTALEGYKDLQRFDGASPDVCVLSESDKDENIVSMHHAVRTLPFVGKFPSNWAAGYWKGPRIATV